MLKMIIADDEAVILRGIRQLVDWHELGISIIADYEDGEQALKGIVDEKPDLAILDIQMPGLTGLEILKEIKERKLNLNTAVIFVSGFQDFEYAKQAIQFGAKGYILKPILREELLNTIGEAIVDNSISNAFSKYKIKYSSSPKTNHSGVPTWDGSGYVPVYCQILSEADYDDPVVRLCHFSIYAFLETYLKDNHLGIILVEGDYKIAILKGSVYAIDALRQIQDQVKERFQQEIGFVMGHAVQQMSEIQIEFQKCLKANRYLYFKDFLISTIISSDQVVFKQKPTIEDVKRSKQRLLDHLLENNLEAIDKELYHYAGVVCRISDGYKEYALLYYCSLIRDVVRDLKEMGVEAEEPDTMTLMEIGRTCVSFVRMKEKYETYFLGFNDLLNQFSKGARNHGISTAIAYIDQHYMEDLSLKKLAAVVHMNPYYFSNFFKKHMGINFKSYLNQIRIERSIPLLLTTDKKIGVIANEIGYQDVRSFNEAFNKAHQCTPLQYRKKIQRK